MNIMLLNPPIINGNPMVREGRCMQRKGAWTALWPPLTLATLAAILREKKFNVFARDYVADRAGIEALLNDVWNFRPSLLILNTVSASLQNDIAVAEEIKKCVNDLFIAGIGLQATAVPESILVRDGIVDVAIVGEPDITVLRLAEALKTRIYLNDINGLAFRKNGTLVRNRPICESMELDSLPMPAWEFFNIKRYTLPFSRRPFLLVTTSRGCPHDCVFCPVWIYYGKVPRFRHPSVIVDEIEYDMKEFGVNDFLFWAESFTLNESHVAGICEEILRRDLKVNWMCNSRVDSINEQMLKLMKKAGCWLIGFGIESGSQRILDNVKKGVSLDLIRKAVQMSRKEGIIVVGHVIIGLPGDDEKSITDTIDFTKELKLDFAQFYCAVPYPGSRLYEDALLNGWLASQDWTLYEQNRSVLSYPSISSKDIEKMRRRAILGFYLRPAALRSLLRVVREHGDFIGLFRSLREFTSWL